MKKPRLSKGEYLKLGRNIKTLRGEYRMVTKTMNGHFPKNSKAIKSMLKTDEALMQLYYDVETEFLHDYPESEVTEYGR